MNQVKQKQRQYMIIMVIILLVGFLGCMLSIALFVNLFGTEPTANEITIISVVISFFFVLMLSSLFFLIPYQKLAKSIERRNFFGYEKKPKTLTPDGAPFLIAQTTDDNLLLRDKILFEYIKMRNRYPLLFLGLIMFFLFVFGLGVVGAFVKIVSEDGSQDLLREKLPLFLSGLGALLLGALILAALILRQRAFNRSPEKAQVEAKIKDFIDGIKSAFEIPETSLDIDTITFSYKCIGKRKSKIYTTTGTPYHCLNFWYFVDKKHLYIADVVNKFQIPLTSIKSIEEITSYINFIGWNKSTSLKEFREFQKKHHVKSINGGFAAHYVIVTIDDPDHGIYQILLPSYEANAFSSLVEIPITKAVPRKQKLS
ncbi:MAG: hypothetical protein LBR37_02220 [Erysipelotrichaceae bacterium]|jgi:hypothetical protein|nr:hypothetical protein [Erysipelotrichaceae bacterium]